MTDLGGGLKFVDTKAGGGRRAERGAKLTCKYRGLCSDHKREASANLTTMAASLFTLRSVRRR